MWYLILLGGGCGARMHLGYNKVLYPLCGKTVVRRSAEAFVGHVDGIVMVCPAGERTAFQRELQELEVPVRFADGGETRQASVWNGLCALPDGCSHVLVHDAARCLVGPETIAAAKQAAQQGGSGVAAVPVNDTIKEADSSGVVRSTPDRSTLWSVQTPQAFEASLLRKAHEEARKAHFIGSDDASLVERMGRSVQLVPGSRSNIKLTTAEDLAMAEALIQQDKRYPSVRFGTGYDVHRLVPERPLILCGVSVPWHLGLAGHSDADVAVHALMDAMLGAAALGDIGQHFPDSDPAYKGISSMKLLEHVVLLLHRHGLRAAQCDVTIVAQAPKLAPFIPAMRESLASALQLPQDRVSVKATTTEHLGFEGRGEGISAQAIAVLTDL